MWRLALGIGWVGKDLGGKLEGAASTLEWAGLAWLVVVEATSLVRYSIARPYAIHLTHTLFDCPLREKGEKGGSIHFSSGQCS